MGNYFYKGSKEEYFQLFKRINTPLRPFYSQSGARIKYIHNGVGYGNKIAEIEGFSRVLWGAGPAFNQLDQEWFQMIVSGIKCGTDPNHPDYWGEINDRDQRIVEMPAIALALIYHENLLWNQFSSQEQQQIANWLSQILEKECADGNWQFFKVIVGTVLKRLGFSINDRDYLAAFEKIEDCYLGEGWYRDSSRGRQDYYNPFAFHYYGLVYSVLEPDAEISAIYQQRALRFSKDYHHFFAENGANVPFGRSMIYRFAVSCFWSAMVWAGLTPISLGEMKGIIQRNISWWLEKEIFDENGILSLGYTYEQLTVTEPYNSTLSPLWLNKLFLLLDLPDNHPFWTTKAIPLKARQETYPLSKAKMIAMHDGQHTVFLNAGQTGVNYHLLSNEKYLKFAYSSYFGFSIPRSYETKSSFAMDSMIGLRRSYSHDEASIDRLEGNYLVRNNVENSRVTNTYSASTWRIPDGSSIRTWLIPFDGWQIRVHRLFLKTDYMVYETGFALSAPPEIDTKVASSENEHFATNKNGFTGLKVFCWPQSYRQSPVTCYPNTSIMTWENTFLPGVECLLTAGEHFLITGIYGHPSKDHAKQKWAQKFDITFLSDSIVRIANNDRDKTINLDE
jgi:hypothetical protein